MDNIDENHRRTVSYYMLLRLKGYLRKRGVPEGLYKPLIEANELRIDDEIRYPIQTHEKILQRAAQFLKDDLFGLKSGTYFRAPKFGLYHFLLSVSGTLRQDLLLSVRYFPLDTQAWRARLVEGPDVSQLIFMPSVSISGRHQLECSISQGVLRLYNTRPPFLKVSFCYDDRGKKAEYEKILRCPVEFNAPVTSVSISTNHFNSTTGWDDVILLEQLEKLAKKRMQSLLSMTSVVDEVKYQVYQYLSTGGQTDLPVVAEIMNMSERSLQKALQGEDTSFRDIINQVRAEMAMDLIRRDDLSTDEIAARVGFEELSSFYRFFKNITGKGVKEIRESLSE